MKIAFGHHTKDPVLKLQELSFEELGEHLNKCKSGAKNEGYFVRGGDMLKAEEYETSGGIKYKDSYIRANKFLKSASVLVLDGDAGADGGNAPSPRAVHEALNKLKLKHIVYTTYSHAPPKKNKFRVVLPCAMQDKSSLAPTVSKLLHELSAFNVNIKHVKEMNVWAQRWYLPTRAYAQDGVFEFYSNYEGSDYIALPPSEELEEGNVKKEDLVHYQKERTNDGTTYEAAVAEMFVNGEGHTNYVPAALALANKGLSAKDIFDTMRPTCIAAFGINGRKWDNFRDRNLQDAITSAIAKVQREKTEAEQEEIEIADISALEDTILADKLDIEILAPPDTAIGELTLALHGTWWVPNIMIAALAARSIIAYLGGGKYRSILGDRMNIQQLAIGETGCGKDMLLQTPGRVLNEMFGNAVPQGAEAELLHGIIDEVGSAQGIDKRLRTNGSKHDILIVQDEFGGMMQGAQNNEHKRGILELLLKFYTKSDSTFAERLLAGTQITKEATEILYAPHVILSSATTPELMLKGIDNSFITHGNASRMMFFNADPYVETIQENCKELHLSEDLISRLKHIADQTEIVSSLVQLPQARVHNPLRVNVTEDARKLAYQASVYNQKRKGRYKDIWNRQVPNAKKYAMIEAILENPAQPEITLEMMHRNLVLIGNACNYTENLYDHNIGENEHDVARKKILEVLKKAGTKWVRKRDIFQTSKLRKLKPFERNQIMKELIDMGEVDEIRKENIRGKPTPLYRLARW